MASNYVLLGRVAVGTNAPTSITFDNIPQSGYTDLKIVASTRVTIANNYSELIMRINGATTNYTCKYLYGLNGASTGAATYTSGYYSRVVGVSSATNATASAFGNSEFYIHNYTSSNYKVISGQGASETNNANGVEILSTITYANTSAVTSVTIESADVAPFVQYSTFDIYGLAAQNITPVIAPYATGGDVVKTDGTYWYHAFLSSGSFTPAKALSCDILQVGGGGGGGGSQHGGGGGAGGVLGFASQSISASSQTVTIGAGGVGGIAGSSGTQGGNSQFASLTASVGGGYGAVYGSAGGNGGSGGGSPYSNSAGTGTSGQGNNGGAGLGSAPNYGSGGGGGAGASGANGTATTGGNGGAGVNTYTNATWLSTALSTIGLGVSGYIAGGGGGSSYNGGTPGTGGSGGGGNGSTTTAPTSGVANTGSGGGGTERTGTTTGANGGSGIVIIRYAI